jgi:hypothetical protein
MAKLNRSGPATSPAETVTSIGAAVVVVAAKVVVVGPVVLVTGSVVLVTIETVEAGEETVLVVTVSPLHAVTISTTPRSQPILVRMMRRYMSTLALGESA